MKTTLENVLAKADQTREQIYEAWQNEVQSIADQFQVEIATGHLSDTWQVNSGLGKDDFRALYDDEENEALLALEALDSKMDGYGVGPSNMERFKPRNPYEVQAESFLSRNGLKFRATLSDSKTPAWAKEGEETGHHYRVTLSRDGKELQELESAFQASGGRGVDLADRIDTLRALPTRLVFDFWGSIADARKLKAATNRKKELGKSISLQEYQLSPIQNHGYARNELSSQNAANMREHLVDLKARLTSVEEEISDAHPSAYDVLACISGDAYTPETFADFCAEYGYESDSIKALQTYRRVSAFSKRLRAFFTAAELEQLSEIQ